jgi:hypothetical protein
VFDQYSPGKGSSAMNDLGSETPPGRSASTNSYGPTVATAASARPPVAPRPLPSPEELEGQEVVAAIAGLVPLIIALYTIVSAGQHLSGATRLMLFLAALGGHGMMVLGVGAVLARRPDRLPAGRTLVALAGFLAPFIAATTWATPRTHLSLLTTLAATVLSVLAAGHYARLWGRGFRTVVAFVGAVFLLGLSGWVAGLLAIPLGSIISLRSSLVLDTAAAVLACAVFLRPDREIEPPGKIAMALAVPLATIVIILLWTGPIFHQIPALIVVIVFAARAIRPYFHDGAVTVLSCGLLAVPLWLAGESVQGRHVALVVGLFAALRTAEEVERDPNIGLLDRTSPAWMAAALWVGLAATWANDLSLFEAILGQPRGLATNPLVWAGLFALPLAVPAFLLAQVRRRAFPDQPDLDQLPAGIPAEVAGWGVLALASTFALLPDSRAVWPNVALATAALSALGGAIWVRAGTAALRRIAAHLLLLALAWLVAQRLGHGPIVLVAPAVALALAVWPLSGRADARQAGVVGLVAFPVFITEAILRGASIPAVTSMLVVYGLVQLLHPPMAELPWTRVAGPIALLSAVWLFLAQTQRTARGPLNVPALLRADPLQIIGILGAVMALVLFVLANRQRRKAAVALPLDDPNYRPLELDPDDPGLSLEALGWTFIGVSATLALVPAPKLGWVAVATLGACWFVAAFEARAYPSVLRRIGAHVILIVGLWVLGLVVAQPLALLTAAAAATLLALSAHAPRLASREAGWVGMLLFPLAIGQALALDAPVLPAAIVLAIFGLVHVARPPLADFPWTRLVGPPALLWAGWLLLFGGAFSPAVLPSTLFSTVAGIALVPFALWAALSGTTLVFSLEVLAGAIALLLHDSSWAALLPLAVLALGRDEIGFAAGATALLLGSAGVVTYGPGAGVPVGAAGFLIAGAVLLIRPLPIDVQRLRTVGPLGMFVAPLALLFVPQASGHPWLAIEHLPLAAAACLWPFALRVRRMPRPSFLIWQTVGAGAAVAILATIAEFLLPQRSVLAIEASGAALLALGAAVAAAGALGPEVSPIVWGFAALAAPIALIPMSTDPWHWPVAAVAVVEVMILGEAARRRLSPVLAAWTLWLGLFVSIWIATASTHHVLGDAPWGLLAMAGAAVAVLGTLVLLVGRVWLGAPPFFLRPFIHTCIALASLTAATTVILGPVTRAAEVTPALLALGCTAVLAARLAWQDRIGWPLFMAAGALVVGYVHLRVRTNFADGLAHWDALVAVAVGLGLALVERPWQEATGPQAPELPLAPDEIPFALPALRVITAFFMALSAVAFANLRGPVDAIGPAIATVFFHRRSRIEAPVYAVLAMLFFDATVVALLAKAGIASPGAYALPICASATWFLHVYRDHLGHEEIALRALPPLAAVVAWGYEAFASNGLIPTFALLGVGLVLLALARRWYLLSHLVLGVLALLLAGIDFATEHHATSASHSEQAFRLLPLATMAFAVAGALVIRLAARLFIDPAEFRSPVVQGLLALASLTLGLTLVVAPANQVTDVVLALVALAAMAVLALYFARFERFGWPLLVAGATPVLGYAYLRARTDWFDLLHRWDALAAVGAGFVFVALERIVRRRGGAPADFEWAAPDEIPFGVREIRLGTAVVMSLSAVAFLDLHGPIDATGPVVAALFFLRRARRDTPAYGVLAVALLYTTMALFLIERHIANPISYALPLGAAVALLMHIYREQLGYEANSLRTVPPLAMAAVCVFEAINANSILVPTVALSALGLALLPLSRLWRVRSHFPIGLGCLAAALLIMISDWNSRGWTIAALALGMATLLVPAVLLRWR